VPPLRVVPPTAGVAAPAEESEGDARQTVFDSSPQVQELPAPMLEAYFSKRQAAVKIDTAQDGRAGQAGAVRSIIDSKRLQMLGILLTKHVMAHKGETAREAVHSVRRAVLQCDYDVVPQESLSVLRQTMRWHAEEGSKITEYVNANGEAALEKLEHPWHHKLVHELLKVPQIDERLECMLFETAFDDSLAKCRGDLETLCIALQVLNQLKALLNRFFVTVHRLGQSLNRDSKAPQAQRGFQLATLDRLVTTKSTRSSKHDLVHFALALMSREDAAKLFTDQHIDALGKAKNMRSYTVYQDCLELTQSFFRVRDIIEIGKYTSCSTGAQVKMEKRRMTMKPASCPKEVEAPIDTDDRFHDHIKSFVNGHLDEAKAIVRGCYSAFQCYKDLAVYLDDMGSVYPPPRSEQDTKQDLVAVLHRLSEHVRSHREEVIQDGLRELLAAPPLGAPPPTTAVPETLATTSV